MVTHYTKNQKQIAVSLPICLVSKINAMTPGYGGRISLFHEALQLYFELHDIEWLSEYEPARPGNPSGKNRR